MGRRRFGASALPAARARLSGAWPQRAVPAQGRGREVSNSSPPGSRVVGLVLPEGRSFLRPRGALVNGEVLPGQGAPGAGDPGGAEPERVPTCGEPSLACGVLPSGLAGGEEDAVAPV